MPQRWLLLSTSVQCSCELLLQWRRVVCRTSGLTPSATSRRCADTCGRGEALASLLLATSYPAQRWFASK